MWDSNEVLRNLFMEVSALQESDHTELSGNVDRMIESSKLVVESLLKCQLTIVTSLNTTLNNNKHKLDLGVVTVIGRSPKERGSIPHNCGQDLAISGKIYSLIYCVKRILSVGEEVLKRTNYLNFMISHTNGYTHIRPGGLNQESIFNGYKSIINSVDALKTVRNAHLAKK